jgi:hypothetical protein
MKLVLSREAVAVLASMVNPASQWPKDAHYRMRDAKAADQLGRLTKWVETRLLGEERVLNSTQARNLALMLGHLYEQPALDEVQALNAWQAAGRVLGRPYQQGTYSLREDLRLFAKELLGHYLDKPAQSLGALGFADLRRALDGEPAITAEDAEDPKDKAEAAQEAAKV